MNLFHDFLYFRLYLGMALTSLRQRKRRADVVKKCTQKLMEPKPCYSGLTRALTTYDVQSDGPLFLNTMSAKRNWSLLSYKKEKNTKKTWRLFKNSSLIRHHVRSVFAEHSMKTQPLQPLFIG